MFSSNTAGSLEEALGKFISIPEKPKYAYKYHENKDAKASGPPF